MEANLFALALAGAFLLVAIGLGLLYFNPAFRKSAVALGAGGFALVSCAGCANVNNARDAIGLAPLPDISAACERIEPDAAAELQTTALKVLRANDQVVCEVYAGIEGYLVLQEAVQALNARALAGDDAMLQDLAIFVSEAEQKARPFVANTNRALDVWLYFDGKVDEFAAQGRDPAAILLEAGRTYAELQEIWREAQPRIHELRIALGMD